MSAPGTSRPPLLVMALAVAFLLLVASLVIGSLVDPEFPPYALSEPPAAPAGDTLVGPVTYTLDASGGDRWQRFHFARGGVVHDGPWDVAFRRNKVIAAPGVGVVDLGPVPFDSVREAPAPEGVYLATELQRDTINPAFGKWYAYSMLSHLLTSKHHVYVVRTAEGPPRFAKLEFLAYYCRDVGTACYTFRYAFQGDRTRRLGEGHRAPGGGPPGAR